MDEVIHIEGMGLLGALLAHRLDQRGEAFTWNDIDTPYSAWYCCTGLAYPDADNRPGLVAWHKALADIPEAAPAPYLYAHKRPPHGAQDAIVEDFGKLRLGAINAVSLNVPAFVHRMRKEHRDHRDAIYPDRTLVRCHTTPKRAGGYLWGWTAKVGLVFKDERVASIAAVHQPALYAKAHRFNLTYAYPIPGEQLWWAGSSLVGQKEPKRVSDDRLQAYLDEWLFNAEMLLGVQGQVAGTVLQGWRPKAAPGDSGRAVRHPDGTWSMPPLATDGMRNGLLVVDDFLDQWDTL